VAQTTPAICGDVGGSFSSLPRQEAEVIVIPSSTEEGENPIAPEGTGKDIVVEASATDTLFGDKVASAEGNPPCIADATKKEATSCAPSSSAPSSGTMTKAAVVRARLAAIDVMASGTDVFYMKMLKAYSYLRENVQVQDLSCLFLFLLFCTIP
jgi:hypothetical protein